MRHVQHFLDQAGLLTPHFIGVDLACQFFIAVGIDLNNTVPTLSHFAFTHLDQMKKDLQDDPQLLHQINAALPMKPCTYSIIAAPSHSVTTHIIDIAADATDAQQEQMIFQAATRLFPHHAKELYFDYVPAPDEIAQKKHNYTAYLLVAAHKNGIERPLQLLKPSHAPTRIVDIDYNAIERGYALIKMAESETPNKTGIIDINADRILLTIFDNNECIYSSYHRYKLDGIIEIIRANLHPPSDQKSTLIDQQSTLLSHEVQHVFNAYLAKELGQPEQLYLSGHAALIPELEQLVTAATNTATLKANPFKGLLQSTHIEPSLLAHYAPACLMTAGLAMRNIHYATH